MKLLFYCSYSKSASMIRWRFLVSQARDYVFLTSRNVSKHIFLTLGVDRTAGDAVKVKFTRVPTYSFASYTLGSVV